MQVIPVIDLLDGHVVRAVRGARAQYRPIRSALAATSEPVALARALIAACGARTLYVADLGAIMQRGAHVQTLAALRAALPGIEIWLDAGFADYASMRAAFERIDAIAAQRDRAPSLPSLPLLPSAALVPVFGTETLRDAHALREAEAAQLAPILSLDHRAGQLVHARGAELAPAAWPRRVIAMTLDQVGSYDGPDLATFARLAELAAPHTQMIGAGGIANRDDLALAARTRASAWLVASALHDGRIGARSDGATST